MADEKISGMPMATYSDTLYLPAMDLSQATGQQNVKISTLTLKNQFASALQQSGLQTVGTSTLGLSVPNGTRGATSNNLAYQLTDQSNTNNAMLLSVEFSIQTAIGTLFNYAIYNGDPDTGGTLVAQNNNPILTTKDGYMIVGQMGPITHFMDFQNSASGFFLNSELKNGIYVQITDMTSSGFAYDAAFTFLLIPPVVGEQPLPLYTPSQFAYSGPSSLSSVTIGPNETFKEMADAIPYLAPGFTMTVQSGIYYEPFVVPTGYDGFTIQAAEGASADTITCNGRGGYYTGLMYNYNAWTGNGPCAGPPCNPFRLAQGKGFIVVECSGTVTGLGFLDCGGGYSYDLRQQGLPTSYGDGSGPAVIDGITVQEGNGGEAGIYVINGSSGTDPITVTIARCTFDGGANGLFVPNYITSSTVGAVNQVGNVLLTIDHCDFSYNVPCGNVDDGLSHNTYLNAKEVTVTSSNFYGCLANSFKSRAVTLNIDNCYFQAMFGRCIDWPQGGTLVVNNSTFSQTTNAIINYLGLANESDENIAESGLPMVPAQFNNCTLLIARFDSVIFIANGQTAVFTNPTQIFYTGTQSTVGLAYDPQGTQSGVTGLVFGQPQDGSVAPAQVVNGVIPDRPTPMHNQA